MLASRVLTLCRVKLTDVSRLTRCPILQTMSLKNSELLAARKIGQRCVPVQWTVRLGTGTRRMPPTTRLSAFPVMRHPMVLATRHGLLPVQRKASRMTLLESKPMCRHPPPRLGTSLQLRTLMLEMVCETLLSLVTRWIDFLHLCEKLEMAHSTNTISQTIITNIGTKRTTVYLHVADVRNSLNTRRQSKKLDQEPPQTLIKNDFRWYCHQIA